MSIESFRILAFTAFSLMFFILGFYAGLSENPAPCVCEVHQ